MFFQNKQTNEGDSWKRECPKCGKKAAQRTARGSLTSWIFDFGVCQCPVQESSLESNAAESKSAGKALAKRSGEESDLKAQSQSLPRREIPPGTVLAGQYKVLNKLGIGGMGDVYRCQESALNRFVAVKILHADLLANPVLMARFQREAKAVAMLDHSNIVKMHNFLFDEAGRPMTVMELLSGVSLAEFLAAGPLPLLRTRRLVAQICDALAHAHKHNVIHRDLKPNNIIVLNPGRENETIKLVDFGIAKIAGDISMTQPGDVFGSPEYMSPEQCVGKPVDARTDQYSLGCLIFEMLTGRPPFVRQSKVAVVMAHVNDVPPLLSQLGDKQFPPDIEACVARLLEKKPKDRFLSVAPIKNIFLGELGPADWKQWQKASTILFAAVWVLLAFALIFRFLRAEKVTPLPDSQFSKTAVDQPGLKMKKDEPLTDAYLADQVSKNPHDYSVLFEKGLDINDTDVKKAVEYWHQSLAANPYRPGMTAAQVQEKRLGTAQVIWARCYAHIGITCLNQGNYHEGISDLNQAQTADPDNPVIYWNRYLAYKRLGQADLARHDYEKFKQLNEELKKRSMQ